MDNIFTLHRGHLPLLLSLPHVGTALPAALRARLVERAGQLEDTDWHLERLYDFVRPLGASVLVPHFSRYVVDLNRPPTNAPMYPGVQPVIDEDAAAPSIASSLIATSTASRTSTIGASAAPLLNDVVFAETAAGRMMVCAAPAP